MNNRHIHIDWYFKVLLLALLLALGVEQQACGYTVRTIIKDGTLNIGAIRGKPIKSIKQTAIENENERKGRSKEKHDGKEQKQSASLQKENVKQTKQVAPAPDPYKWRYIFHLSLVLLTGALYFNRMPIINWIKKILYGLVKQ